MKGTPDMTTATSDRAQTITRYLNPIIQSTINTFEMMLNSSAKRTGIVLSSGRMEGPSLSAVISLTGKANGTIVLNVHNEVAFNVFERMLGIKPDAVNDEVRDAVGELVNMIAGGAKAQLKELELSLGIPNLIDGDSYALHFPTDMERPLSIEFTSDIGKFTIDFSFRDQ
jgi:chemotaxis protein CheX